MHGIILEQLRLFIFSTVNTHIWQEALTSIEAEKLGIDSDKFPEEQKFENFILHLVKLSGSKKEDFLVEFGNHLVPTLINIYKISPESKLLDTLIKVEESLHNTIHKNFLESEPVSLNVIRVNTKRAEIIYSSRFEMPEIAMGIIQGLGFYLKERTAIEYHLLADGNHLISVEIF